VKIGKAENSLAWKLWIVLANVLIAIEKQQLQLYPFLLTADEKLFFSWRKALRTSN